MKTIAAYANVSAESRGAVVAIGNFDGVHRGHQALLERAKALASEKGAPFGVLTFEPHPKKLFRPDEPPERITPHDIKSWRLEQSRADILYSLTFDWDFASLSAQDFIDKILIAGLGVSHVVVGYDFRFGQLRKGGAADIRAAGIDVTEIPEQAGAGGQAYSSSRIREALRRGDIDAANAILGWDWEICGVVVKGDRRGHDLGYPTANFGLGETLHPAYGVYAALVQVEGEQEWRGAAINIGIRPMFEIPQAQVESHIFDFNSDIYGRVLRVRPIRRLRSEAKFNSLDELKDQMARDCQQAREILKL